MPSFKFPSIFKTPKAHRFTFKTRYYDEQKEKMEERINRIQSENKNETNETARIKSNIHDVFQYRRKVSDRKSQRQSNIRMVVILMILLFLAWWVLH